MTARHSRRARTMVMRRRHPAMRGRARRSTNKPARVLAAQSRLACAIELSSSHSASFVVFVADGRSLTRGVGFVTGGRSLARGVVCVAETSPPSRVARARVARRRGDSSSRLRSTRRQSRRRWASRSSSSR